MKSARALSGLLVFLIVFLLVFPVAGCTRESPAKERESGSSVSASKAAAAPGAAVKAATWSERIVAGGPDDCLLVRHLVVRGSDSQIGRRLAEWARDQHGVQPTEGGDPLKLRVQKDYLARNYPFFFERMRGVAQAYGRTLEEEGVGFVSLPYNLGGCSVVFYPPAATGLGYGVLSRNYDFTTGTLAGRVPQVGEAGATSRPYVLELYPDRGYASLAIVAYDLLGSAMDGINSEGLCVALLADDESSSSRDMEPAGGLEVGLNEINLPRFLLETCANCDEARAMLLSSKHYYSYTPCHYIVADRYGDSFVWEYSYSMNKEYVVEGGGEPQVVTNHPLYRWLEQELPAEEPTGLDSHARFRTLRRSIESHAEPWTTDFIKEINAGVAACHASVGEEWALHRTLWHALYYPEKRKLEVDFYLRDEASPENPAQTRIVRSGYLDFQLDPASWSSSQGS